jgi:hypothetical protein
MVPDFALRLDSILCALKEVVIPALDANNKNAIEQAHLISAHIRIISEQIDLGTQYYLAELRDHIALVDDLLVVENNAGAACTEATAALQVARPLAATRVPALSELSAVVSRLKSAADGIIKSSDRQAKRDKVNRLVMQHAVGQIRRDRAWVRGAGIDIEANKLPPLRELL